MAQFLNTPWISTPVPGAYVRTQVISNASGLATSGVILIMGEADGGPDYSVVTLANNFYGPTSLNKVRSIYTSGPIVDAFAALSAPSNDPDIVGTANSIFIIKTNKGTQATASVPGYGVFTALNYGVGGNLFNFTVTSLDTEVPPQVTGTTIPAFGAILNGDTFTIRLNGGVADVITLSGPGGASAEDAQIDAQAAYTSLQAMPNSGTSGGLINSELGGQSLAPGVYIATTGTAGSFTLNGTLTLTGTATDVFVFQTTASTIITGGTSTPTIVLAGGALAKNVYWLAGSSATINSAFTGVFQGSVIAQASITDTMGGTVNGSLIALTGAVTLSAATIVNAQNSPLLLSAGQFGLLGASAVTGSAAVGTIVNGDVGSFPTNTITNFPPGIINIAAHANIAALVIELNSLLPAGIVASAGAAPNTLVLTMDPSAFPYASGSGLSFELIDSTPGDLAALGLVAGLTVSSQEPGVEVQIINSSVGVNEVFNVVPVVALSVGYEGTTATMTITSTNLTTSVTGGVGANLNMVLAEFSTISQIAAFINSQPGYSASAGAAATSLPPSALDQVTAIGIDATEADTQPGRVKNSLYAFVTRMGTSTVLGFTPSAVAGLPVPGILTYLSGGTKGGTLAVDIVNAIAQMAGIQLNIIVPLFSQDAPADILAGNTDPTSTYTISAINELIKSHCIQFSTPTLKRNRMAILSLNDTYANCKVQSQGLASYRCALTCQQVVQINSAGNSQLFLPWYASCVAAGMMAGGFYKSICNHLANIISFQDPVGYDSGDPTDVADAIIAGLLVLTQNTSGILWVSDQTTYGLDTNFVYNSIQAVYLSDILALDLAQSFQRAIVGKSVADVSAASALSFLQQKFDFYKKLKMVSTSDDAPLGYKNASIEISAPSMFVSVEAKLTTSIYFVAIDLALSSVQQSAA